jgi:hypothetical protein
MVACPPDHRTDPAGGTYRSGWKFGPGSLYLHVILAMDKSKQYETVLVVVLGCIVVYLFSHARWWLPAALSIGLLALLIPAVAWGIDLVWTKLSQLLGEVSGRVLLTIVYILLLVPLAVLARVFGHAGLRRKKTAGSYFTERNHRYEKEDLIHPW